MKREGTQSTATLIRRFWPYLTQYRGILIFDLFCAALTTVCELVLPMLMRTVTNLGAENLESLTLSLVLRIGALYLVLRIIDAVALGTPLFSTL